MLNDEARLLIDIWEGIRDSIPAAKRPDVAEAVMQAFADHGHDARALSAIKDEDDDLQAAFDAVFSDGESEETEEEDE